MHLTKLTVFLLFVILFIQSCGVRRYIGEEQYLLRNVKVKESNSDLKGALEPYIRQEPNSRFAGLFPFKLWFYALADRGNENKIKWWMKNKLGEAITILDTNKVNESRILMTKLLRNKGYFNALVDPDMKYGKRKVKLSFKINKNKPYYLNEVHYKTDIPYINDNIKDITKESLLIKGETYDIDIFEKERHRIVNKLKNIGLYQFYKDMLFFELDTSNGEQKIDVLVKLNPVYDNKNMSRYLIKNVYSTKTI